MPNAELARAVGSTIDRSGSARSVCERTSVPVDGPPHALTTAAAAVMAATITASRARRMPPSMTAMQVTATDAAVAVVRQARSRRSGVLTITLGTGCCESTAPFLYEDHLPGPDHEPVGEVDGV